MNLHKRSKIKAHRLYYKKYAYWNTRYNLNRLVQLCKKHFEEWNNHNGGLFQWEAIE